LWAILRILKDGELQPSDTDQEICQDLVHSILQFSVPIGLVTRKADSAPEGKFDRRSHLQDLQELIVL
jgi:hypothetical protein